MHICVTRRSLSSRQIKGLFTFLLYYNNTKKMTHVLPFNFHFQVIIIQDHQSWSIYNEFIHWFSVGYSVGFFFLSSQCINYPYFIMPYHDSLTLSDLVTSTCINKLGHHWFSQYLVRSHSQNQCWLFTNKIFKTNFNEIWEIQIESIFF